MLQNKLLVLWVEIQTKLLNEQNKARLISLTKSLCKNLLFSLSFDKEDNMALFRVGRDGWKYGRKGHVYHGAWAFEKAVRQGRAIAIYKARRSGHKIPHDKEKPLRRMIHLIGYRARLHKKEITHHLRYNRGY